MDKVLTEAIIPSLKEKVEDVLDSLTITEQGQTRANNLPTSIHYGNFQTSTTQASLTVWCETKNLDNGGSGSGGAFTLQPATDTTVGLMLPSQCTAINNLQTTIDNAIAASVGDINTLLEQYDTGAGV